MSPDGRPARVPAPGLALQGVTVSLALPGAAPRVLVPPLDAVVAAGDTLVVMGESGSGKSSLLAHLAGLLEPPFVGGGRVLLGDDDVTAWPVERRRIGLLFQDDLLFPHLTVLDNLRFAAPAARRADRAARDRQLHDALAAAGLDGLAARRPHALSGGQRSRVSLLRALLARPRVLLLDEPYARLDRPRRAAMRDFVQLALTRHGVPAVLVTHDPEDVPPGARVVNLDAAPAADGWQEVAR